MPTAFSEMSAALGEVSAAGASVWKPAQVGLCPGCGSEDGLGFDTRLRRYSPRGGWCCASTHPAAGGLLLTREPRPGWPGAAG